MSERFDIAARIAEFIRETRMISPYGGDVSKEPRKYSVGFSKPRVLDGVVEVYGPKFIRVVYQTQFRDLPNSASTVFETEANVIDFLNKAFVLHDFQGALVVPHRNK